MARFSIHLSRPSFWHETAVIELDASSADDAREIALTMADEGDVPWVETERRGDADPRVELVEELDEAGEVIARTEPDAARPFTVLLLYPDYMQDSGYDSYMAHVMAASPAEAVQAARQQWTNDSGGEDDADDFAVLFVCAGHVDDLGGAA